MHIRCARVAGRLFRRRGRPARAEGEDSLFPDRDARTPARRRGEPGGGSNQPYYTVSGDAVYRYITDIYNPDRVNWPEVTPASTVKITFRAYVFTYANIVTTGSENNWTVPYYTNDAALKSFLEGRGLNTEWWKFEPLTVDMRHPDIIKGLADALLGCREGDAVEVYMTYNMAYGDDYFGLIPNESPIAWFFTVDAVDPVDADAPVEPAN